MPLKQHAFYVYHQENRVMARRGEEAPVVAETCATAQEAHDKVQAIVNPEGERPADFRIVEGGNVVSDLGFLDPRFQNAISGNCEAYVTSAYARTKKA